MARNRRQLETWSPLTLSVQIISLEVCFYTLTAIFLFSLSVSLDLPFSLDLIFSWTGFQTSNEFRYVLASAYGFASASLVVAIVAIVRKPKLVLDFVLTIHGVHFLCVCFTSGEIPRSALWWGWYGASITGVWLGAWYGCAWCMKALSFGQTRETQSYELV